MSNYSEKMAKAKEPRVAPMRSEADAYIECFKHDAAYLEVSWAAVRFFEDITSVFLSYIRSMQRYKTTEGEVDDDGYFPCVIDYAQNGCGLGRDAQDRSLATLIKLGLVHKKVIGLPPKRWLKLDVRAYQVFVETYSTLPQTWPVSYKKAAEFCGPEVTDIVGIVEKYVPFLIETSKSKNEGNPQIEMRETSESKCGKPATDKHRGYEHRVNEHREKGTVTSYRDEGPAGASSPDGFADAPGVENATPAQVTKEQPTSANESRQATPPAYSRKSKPRHKPAPLPAHSAIPFMQTLANVLEPILANKAHAAYPTEGDTAYKYHLDALEAYDAIQTGAILARPLAKPERYTSPVPWGNPYRLERLKLWAKDRIAMETDLLAAARIYAASREHNLTVAQLPSVAAFLFGATPEGGFLPWWNFVKPADAMEAKEKKVLAQAAGVPNSQAMFLEMEAKGHIERNSFEHKKFIKLFGREPNTLKETK